MSYEKELIIDNENFKDYFKSLTKSYSFASRIIAKVDMKAFISMNSFL
jgi:hypothetical protein